MPFIEMLSLVCSLTLMFAGLACSDSSATAVAHANSIHSAGLLKDGQGWMLTNRQLLWSNDGGLSWTDVTPTGVPAHSISKVHFLDAHHGWVASLLSSGSGFPALTCSRTTDGGLSWLGDKRSNKRCKRCCFPGNRWDCDLLRSRKLRHQQLYLCGSSEIVCRRLGLAASHVWLDSRIV